MIAEFFQDRMVDLDFVKMYVLCCLVAIGLILGLVVVLSISSVADLYDTLKGKIKNETQAV
jgi:hypothetical protein